MKFDLIEEEKINIVNFTDFRIVSGRIDFISERIRNGVIKKKDYYFELSEPFIPSQDAIAGTVIQIINGTYKKIYIDLSVSKSIAQAIKEKYPESDIAFKEVYEQHNIIQQNKPQHEKYVILFSGGLDSLAMHYLFPEVTLLSFEYIHEKHYEREKEMFSKFDPYIIKTNTRDFELFQGTIEMIYQEYLGFNGILTGDVFENGVGSRTSMKRFGQFVMKKDPVRETKNIKMYPSYYLTEIGTTMLLAHYGYEQVPFALKSCAAVGSIKKLRKDLLTKTVYERLNLKQNFEVTTNLPKKKLSFGSNILEDFISIYLIKYLGYEEVNKSMEIPNEQLTKIKSTISTLTLDFYQRCNTNLLDAIPKEKRNKTLERLLDAGILFFMERDWYELSEVLNLLKPYHSFLT